MLLQLLSAPRKNSCLGFPGWSAFLTSDDIIVYISEFWEAIQRLCTVLQRLHDAGLKFSTRSTSSSRNPSFFLATRWVAERYPWAPEDRGDAKLALATNTKWWNFASFITEFDTVGTPSKTCFSGKISINYSSNFDLSDHQVYHSFIHKANFFTHAS